MDNLPKVTGVNRKIAFSDASASAGAASAARNTKLDSFKTTTKTGVFVPFSGKGYTLGNK